MVVGEKTRPLVAVPLEATHVYVLAPLPFTLTVLPIQIKVLVAVAVTVGSALTVALITKL